MTAPSAAGVNKTARSAAGFTLLEVLVALAVLGLLMAGLTQGVRLGLLAWDRQTRAIAQRGELDAIDRVLRRLVEQMDPGTENVPARILGSAQAMEFATDLGPAAGAQVREADIRLVLEGRRLLLRWRPHLHAARLAPPPPPAETELLRDVAGLQIAYWSPSPGAWRSDWQEPRPPALVRLRLRFAEGDGRSWPDIIARPLRETPLR